MRRNEFDEASQVRRNLAYNPNMVATLTNQSLRQNLLTNPRTEYTTGLLNSVVRTNLFVDPRGVAGSSSAYGTNQPIVGNVAISGHPEGITTAIRVSYDTTSTNPGINLYGNTVAGQTYTMTAWVFHETIAATPGSQGFAQAGVLSQPSPPAIVAGVWQKHTWQHTPANANPYGFRVSGQNGTGSYLITGILFEQTKVAAPTYFDGVDSPALRTNLVPNSSAVLGNAWFLASGLPASGTTGNAGGPLGTPYARNRITATGTGTGYFAMAHGSTTPAQWTPAAPGRTYTASAYVRATMVNYQQPGFRLRWKDAAGVTISDQPIVYATGTTSGQWVRLNSTGTAPAGTRYIELMVGFVTIDLSTLAVNDSIDMSAALVEEGSTLGAYFDGSTTAAGGVTYGFRGAANASLSYARDTELQGSWSGTTNASTSRVLGPSMEGWAQATTAGIYRTTTQASPLTGGTYTAAVVTAGFNGDGIYFNDITVTAGVAYTASAWIKISDVPPTMSSVMRFKDAGGTILQDLGATVHTSLVVGQWVRVSTTATAPATATKLQQMWRIYASHTPTTFYLTGAMVEASPVMGGYIDGAYAAPADLVHSWLGAAHRSVSGQYATPVAGIITTKSTSGVSIDSKFFAYQATAEDGKKISRYVAPAGTANSTWRIAGINASGGWDFSKIKAGSTYTVWFRWRSMGWAAASTVQVQISTGGSTSHVTTASQNITMSTALQSDWQEYRKTFTALVDGTSLHWLYISLPATPHATNDGIFDIREWGLYEGTYTGDPIDGGKPLAKWEGTTDASTSIGYPQQLLDIAGKPELDYPAGTSTYTLPGGVAGTTPRTFYTVIHNKTILTSGVSPIIAYGQTNLNDTIPNNFITLRQQTWGGGTNSVMARKTGGGGAQTGTSKIGVHVSCWGIDDRGLVFNSGQNNPIVFDGAMDVPHEKLFVYAPTTSEAHIRTIMYWGYHDAATRAAVSRYLGNKYGAAVI